jgi:outer membrane protein assembly factor BamE (lipoprotein component of BamABCDE complex)
MIKSTVAVLLLAGISGCAGTNFVRPDSDSLKNGQTTYSQVTAKFGQPRQEGSVIKNEQTLKTATYAYASMGGKPLNEGVTAARAAGFYFHNDVLVGYEFISSWAEDHTNFDESRIKDIVKGKTTRAEITQLMGKPGGYHIFPLIKAATGEAAVYAYMEVKGFTPFRKELRVTFDNAGVVTDVEFSSSGRK